MCAISFQRSAMLSSHRLFLLKSDVTPDRFRVDLQAQAIWHFASYTCKRICGGLPRRIMTNKLRSFPTNFALFLLIFSAVSAAAVRAQDKDWRPVTPEELGLNTPRVEPGADAEAIFWEIR